MGHLHLRAALTASTAALVRSQGGLRFWNPTTGDQVHLSVSFLNGLLVVALSRIKKLEIKSDMEDEGSK